MQSPEQYKSLNAEERKTVVLNLIDKCGYGKTPEIVNTLTDDQFDFLFNYVFVASKEERVKMLDTIQKKYETAVNNLKTIAKELQKLDIQFSELLAQKEDAEEFMKNIM